MEEELPLNKPLIFPEILGPKAIMSVTIKHAVLKPTAKALNIISHLLSPASARFTRCPVPPLHLPGPCGRMWAEKGGDNDGKNGN